MTFLDVIQIIFVTDSSARDLNDQLKLRNAKGKKGYKGGERSESRNIRFFFELAGSKTGKRWRHDRPPKGNLQYIQYIDIS